VALVKCRECGHEVSDQAETCPHCGIKAPGAADRQAPPPPPQAPKKKPAGCLTVIGGMIVCIIAVIAVVSIINAVSNNGQLPGSSSASTSSQQPAPNAPPSDNASSPSDSGNADAPSCNSDWHACKDNADLVNHYSGWSTLPADCQEKVDAEVQYGEPKWPGFWSGGAFEHFFSGTGYISTGIAVAIEPNVQVQNEFGAMVHSTAYCRYDLNSQSVLSVSVSPN
jgi:hypothetical protein